MSRQTDSVCSMISKSYCSPLVLLMILSCVTVITHAQITTVSAESSRTSGSPIEVRDDNSLCPLPLEVEELKEVSLSCVRVSKCLLGYSLSKSLNACQSISEGCFSDLYFKLGYSFKRSRARCEFVNSKCYWIERQQGQTSDAASNSCFEEAPQNN